MGWLRVPSALVLLLFGVLLGLLPEEALGYNSLTCQPNTFIRWQAGSTPFDYAGTNPPFGQSIAEGWWQAEIIYANAVWDDPSVGANFQFNADGGSTHDWFKYTDYSTSAIAMTYIQYSGTTCYLSDADTYFNTRYTFEVCNPCSGTHDVRTVAIHEFGHWLSLGEIPEWKIWDNNCVMYPEHGVDRDLCDHDIAGINEIYP